MIQNRLIKKWKEFDRIIRPNQLKLLKRLDEFPDSVLISGCQRSGTTMLSRIITQSEGMVDFTFGKDDELDAALILSGNVDYHNKGRHCFQTTYLNECYFEYFEHTNGHKIVWLLRNPYSTVRSLAKNWDRLALNVLFKGCGVPLIQEPYKSYHNRFGLWIISKLRMACLSYNGKTKQIFEIKGRLGDDNVMVVDYDELVGNKEVVIPAIYKFIDLPYKPEYFDMIHCKSIKKSDRLSKRERKTIEELCVPFYEKARTLITKLEST